MTSALQSPQHIALLPGIREDVDPTAAPLGTLSDAQNVRYGRLGGIYPRYGTDQILTAAQTTSFSSSNVAAATGTYTKDGTPFTLAGGTTWIRDQTTGILVASGGHSRTVPYRELGAPNPATIPSVMVAYGVAMNSAGYTLVITGSQARVYHPSGALVWEADDGFTDVIASRCVAVGADFVYVYQRGATLSGYRVRDVGVLVGGGISRQSATPATFPFLSTSGWDICAAANGTQWFSVIQSAGGTLRMDLYNLPATSVANNTQAVTVADTACTIYADANRVWLGWYENPAVDGFVRHRTFNVSTLAAIDATQQIDAVPIDGGPPLIGPAVTGNTYSATAFAVWRYGTATACHTKFRHVIGNATVGTVRLLSNFTPLSKPSSQNRIWTMSGNRSTNCTTQRAVMFQMYSTIDEDYDEPQIACSRKLTEAPDASFRLCASGRARTFASIGEYQGRETFCLPEVLLKGDATAGPLLSYMLFETRSFTAEPFRATLNDSEMLTVMGQPREFRGMRTAPAFVSAVKNGQGKGGVEIGFAYAPVVFTATQAGGGSLTATGNYSWIFIFESVDSYGRVHRSAPSAPYTIAALGVGNTKVTFEVTSLDGSDRLASWFSNSVSIVAYRTKSAQPGVYYRESGIGGSAGLLTTDGIVTYVSTVSDTTLGDIGSVLYTDGGVKDNDLAPAARFACLTEDRIVLGGLFNPYLTQVSKQIFAGFPVEFSSSDAFTIAWPEPLTALAYQDGSIIGFADSAIYVVGGDGPDDTGQGSFTTPRAICRDIGCPESLGGWRSVVETGRGIFFRSARGFYLLPRGNGVPQFIGAGVQRMFSATAYPACFASAVYQHADHRTVRWLLATGSSLGSSTRVAIYDLDASERDPLAGWSYDTFAQNLCTIGAWPNGFAIITAALTFGLGYLEQATPTQLGDYNSTEAITSAIETNDWRLAGPAGQFKLLTCTVLFSAPDGGTTVTTCTLTPDGDGASATALASTGISASGAAYRTIATAAPTCSSARFRISAARQFTKRGGAMHAMTLEVNPVGGARRTTTAERT